MKTIQWDGDTWRILATGAKRDGKTCCHLASTTRFVPQKNGKRAVQMCDWLPDDLIAQA